MTTTILAIHAHPDDCEILAGGTLARLAGAGHRVVMATFTPGDCGSREHGADEISAIRRSEAAASARLIGAEYRCLEFRDLAVFNDDPSRRSVVAALREVRPDIVITGSPVDYMADHETASMLVRDACFAAPCPNYAAGSAPAIDAIPHLYYMDAVAGVDRENRPVMADFYVDVAPVFETKKRMLASHASQRNWLLRHHHVDDYMIQMERWTRLSGSRAGVELAEGFRHYRGHPYPESPLLQELLGRAVSAGGGQHNAPE